MDVNETAVISTIEKNQAQRLIHGHTHRPNVHKHTVNGEQVERFVLAEWDHDGSVLDWSESGYEVIKLS